jgi:hypothetical protein
MLNNMVNWRVVAQLAGGVITIKEKAVLKKQHWEVGSSIAVN